jgi:hypothetical protein
MMSSKMIIWIGMAVIAGVGIATLINPPARRRRERLMQSERVDEASEDSFPASDPPSHSAPSAGVQRSAF